MDKAKLTPTEVTLLKYLRRESDSQNRLARPITEISKEIGVARWSIYRALQSLKEKNMVLFYPGKNPKTPGVLEYKGPAEERKDIDSLMGYHKKNTTHASGSF